MYREHLSEHVVRRIGVHQRTDVLHDLVTGEAEHRGAEKAPDSVSTKMLTIPSVSPSSCARVTADMGTVALLTLRPDARACSSVMPTRPSGGSVNNAYVSIRQSAVRSPPLGVGQDLVVLLRGCVKRLGR